MGSCYRCNLPYDQFSCDMIIQGDLWELINPSKHPGGGLLCPDCICVRLMELRINGNHLSAVHCVVDVAELLPKKSEAHDG